METGRLNWLRFALVTAVICLADIGIYTAGESVPMAGEDGTLRIIPAGLLQTSLTFLFWMAASLSLYKIFAPLQPGFNRMWLAMAVLWLAWIGWLGALFIPYQENLSQSLIVCITVVLAAVMASSMGKDGDKVRIYILMGVNVLILVCGCLDLYWISFNGAAATRWRSPWASPNTFGAFCAIGLIYLVCSFPERWPRRGEGRGYALAKAGLIMANSIGILESKSRTALWGGIIALAVVALANFMLQRRWAATVLLLGIFCAVIWGMSNFSTLVKSDTSGPRSIEKLARMPTDEDKSWGNRMDAWRASLVLGAETPLGGNGWGFTSFYTRVGLPPSFDMRAANLNNFTSLFAARGGFGIAGFFIVIAYPICVQANKSLKAGRIRGPMLPILTFMGLQSAVCGVLYAIPLGIVFWLLAMSSIEPDRGYPEDKP